VDAAASAAASASARIAEEMSGVGGALTMSIIAFSVVFLVLGGLSGVIYAIKYIAQGLERKKNAPPAVSPPPSSSVPEVVAASQPATDGRLMAVLAAAVAASGIVGRIVGVAPAEGSRTRPARSGGWRSAALAEGIQALSRDWK
jgi:Na+-transporting methylmalonyl-CoA/oxaloacetate decarboxylase gamma subunit